MNRLTNSLLVVALVFTASQSFAAMQFTNTTSNYINTPLVLTTTGTVTLWFKAPAQTSNSSSILRPLIAQGDFDGAGGVTQEGVQISILRAGSAVAGQLIYSWGQDGGTAYSVVTATDNQWHHVAIVSPGPSKTAVGYLDGNRVVTFTTGTGVDSAPKFQIGGSSSIFTGARFADATISEVRAYNYALSDNEILTLSRSRLRFPCGIEQGCVGYWPLDDGDAGYPTATVVDSVGGNHARMSPLDTGISTVPYNQDNDLLSTSFISTFPIGQSGRSLFFNGTSNTLILSTTTISGQTSASITAWVNMTATPPTGISRTIFIQNTSSSTALTRFGLFITSNSRVQFGGRGSASDIAGPFVGKFSVETISLSSWTHLAGTWNGTTGEIFIYRDGIAVSTTDVAPSNVATVFSNAHVPSNGAHVRFSIGSSDDNNTGSLQQQFQGYLRDVRIYHSALSASDVLAIRNGQAASVNPAYSWSMDLPFFATDRSGNGNHGSPYFSATWRGDDWISSP